MTRTDSQSLWRYEVTTASKRWQDYDTMVFGVLLNISPFVFGETSHHISSVGAYVLGALLVLSGIVATADGRQPKVKTMPNGR